MLPTKKDWLYLCVVLDCFARTIVGWGVCSDKINSELVTSAIQHTISFRKPGKGVIFHSDRGSQYASSSVIKLLKQHEFHQCMSNAGNCYDNAISESFFATLKTELIHKCNFLS
ncbi:MAG: hypothetical protein DCC88_12110 [Spirobacillus cienkowskii]|jgi:putative transposase|uniref:Integrase catalytic domain-containing protein n=1 Tax=Spirobacillus cienkowskii TaxID=495820 RepID=A0A369KKB1_9BACT|nr:MAG: hypothetical protein DCC88_12110 [Spirobacillus cienkowskii]